ncbi:MAG: ribonuclease III [Lachnospiraceae bacterium]
MKREHSLSSLEDKIGYHFQNEHLLRQALTHSSYANEHHMDKIYCNERLEFLGDAVLEVVSSDFLYHTHENVPEGQLTKMRASMVCEPTLALCAAEIDLGGFLFLGKGEESTGGRLRDSITSDALEALIGAIYLDGGFANAKEFVLKYVMNDLENKKLFFDSKTILQEIVQRDYNKSLSYEQVDEYGPDHDKTFVVRALIGEEEVGVGKGRTKKAAQQMAAYQAILKIRKRG